MPCIKFKDTGNMSIYLYIRVIINNKRNNLIYICSKNTIFKDNFFEKFFKWVFLNYKFFSLL